MKTSVVPAQVTTIEDKIAGSLNLSQLLLLASSVFISFGIYIIVPPNMKFSPIKIIGCFVVFLFLSSMAIRIKGKILAEWLVILISYIARPGIYLYDKNNSYLRNSSEIVKDPENSNPVSEKIITHRPHLSIPPIHAIRLEQTLAKSKAKFNIRATDKGEIYVHITEVE